MRRSLFTYLFVALLAAGQGGCGTPTSDLAMAALPSFSVQQLEGGKPICIVTSYTRNLAGFGDLVRKNHRTYAERHGYTARAYTGRPSGRRFLDPTRGRPNELFGGGLYWQKIDVMQRLQRGEGLAGGTCTWTMWVDADALFSNHALRLEDLIVEAGGEVEASPRDEGAQPSTQVILSSEVVVPVNAGVFLVKNSALGRAFLADVAARYPAYKGHCLPEQDAMGDLAFPQGIGVPAATPAHIRVLPQRRMNSFYTPQYMGKNALAGWEPCDFIAHMTATSVDARKHRALEIMAQVPSCG